MVHPEGRGASPVQTIPLAHLSLGKEICVHSCNLSIILQLTSSRNIGGFTGNTRRQLGSSESNEQSEQYFPYANPVKSARLARICVSPYTSRQDG
jgi:hypothetical protein|uniref:Uncharacterized protein n=1 Tax=Picea glauca TaxID=3330 RepID=A0A101LZB2_PICGL|nr:hypothetical protein ABT39_MTgene5130 [Picea glauca]QHR86422.1 hypothetical protein Q903MT_gene421 [Picea sitchensis]